MSEQLLELIIAIIVAVIGYVIGIFKDRQYNIKVEDVYNKYKLLFDVSGAVIKTIDEKLYVEMEEAIAKMKEAYESTSFTTQAFNEIVKECKDVFDRAQILLKKRE